MKRFKHLILFMGLFLAVATTSNAQSMLTEDQKAKVSESAQELMYDLNLSERDKPAFTAIIRDFYVGLAALKATDFSGDTNQKVVQALRDGRDERAKNMLSDDQWKVFKEHSKDQRSKVRDFLKG